MTEAIYPGDKVLCISDSFYRPDTFLFTRLPKKKEVHSVRKVTYDTTGAPIVFLSGIFGCPVDDFEEPGFRATRFKKLSSDPRVAPIAEADVVLIPVKVPSRMADDLRGVPLFPQVENFSALGLQHKDEAVLIRWTSAHRMSKSLSAMHAEISMRLAGGAGVTLEVPMSALGVSDLLEVCRRLEIEPEAWLQGVIGNLARRVERMRDGYECAVRNEPKREEQRRRRNR